MLSKYFYKIPDYLYKFVYIIIIIGVSLQSITGMVWIVKNIDFITKYGDTTAYLAAAKTFVFGDFRTIFYPLLIWFTKLVSENYFHVLIHLIQLSINFIGIYMLATDLQIKKKWDFLLFFCFLFFSPLNIHFNLSILTDSLALSFSLICVSLIYRFFYQSRSSQTSLFILYLSIICMSLSRVEKLHTFVLIFGILLVYNIYLKRNALTVFFKRKLIPILLVFVISIFSVQIIRKYTTSEVDPSYPKLPPATFTYIFLSKVTTSRMHILYPYFTDEQKKLLPYEEVLKYDAHHNNQRDVLYDIYNGDWEKTAILAKSIIVIAFKYQGKEIISDLFRFFYYYLITPVAFMQHQGVYDWTVSRMAEHHHNTTNLYLNIFFVNLYVMLIIGLTVTLVNIKKLFPYLKNNFNIYFPWLSLTLINAVIFGFIGEFPYHERYGMPSNIIFLAFLLGIIFKRL